MRAEKIRIPTRICATLVGVLAVSAVAAAAERFDVADVSRLADVYEPEFSPDGNTIVYSVTVSETELDLQQSDIWRVNWDGSEREPLTRTPQASEWQPSYSPNGRWIAFLSDRGEEDAPTQVWVMPTRGGEARQITEFPGGVSDFRWSPDSEWLAIIATDPEREPGSDEPANPPPIVIDRYFFKEDESDYLAGGRQHLYLFELDDGDVTQLTRGDSDEYLPEWAPDGSNIAFVTKRGDEVDRTLNFDVYVIEPKAGAVERQLTAYAGGDHDPAQGARLAWSPDSRRIAYLQAGEDRWIYYSPWRLAVVDVATGASTMPAPVDRWFYQMDWSPDGRSIVALVEESRVMHLQRIDVRTGRMTSLTSGLRFDYDFAQSRDGRIVVLGGDDTHPYGLAAVERKGLRVIADHNEFLRDRDLATVEPITFKSADGTDIDGMLMRPVGYEAGKRYPTVLRIHGGPVWQYYHEFQTEWQVLAARGYAVVAANPRGSSGRGFEFAKTIYADWGNKDVADVLAAVDHVVAMGVADPARLGVGGHSYGSILTNYVIASDTRFKAATSSAGSSEFFGMYGHDQYVREYELELGPPWKNPDVYVKLSYPFLHADRIRTPTSFYCGEKDFNVPCLGSEQMYQALRSLGVPTQLVIYPGENHTLAVPSYVRDRLDRYIGWYDRFLKPAPQGGR